MINSEFRKKMADSWFSYLQMQICKSFEQLENNKLYFAKRDWNKKKAPSGAPLYEVYAVDIFSSESRIDHVTKHIDLMETIVDNDKNKSLHVPSIFVVQIQIPSEKPPMFSTVEDGAGKMINHYYYK